MVSIKSDSLCSKSAPYYYEALSNLPLDSVPEEIANHLKQCNYCIKEIGRLKNELQKPNMSSETGNIAKCLELHFSYIDRTVTCSDARLFLANMADENIRLTIATPITDHFDKCQQCASDLHTLWGLHLSHSQLCNLAQILAENEKKGQPDFKQYLCERLESIEIPHEIHAAICGICDRQESGISTSYVLSESDRAMIAPKSDSVQPLRIEERLKACTKPSWLKLHRNQFVKSAIAAAAVFVVTWALFFNSSTASGLDLSHIYSALAKAANIHITRFVPSDIKPVQEQWLSRPLGINALRNGSELVVWDVLNTNRVSKSLSTNLIEHASLTNDEVFKMRQNIEGSLSLMPFDTVSDVPQNSRWMELQEANNSQESIDTKVYDLLWTEQEPTGSVLYKKWRVFVNSNTNLPKRVERYQKMRDENEYHLTSYVQIDYPTADEIQAVAKSAGL